MNTWDLQYQSNNMMWPSEMLIRMFKGTRMPRCNFDKTKYKDQSIIDIGCGDCSNFPLYKQLDFKRICGVEITDKIVDLNNARMKQMNIDSEVRVGTNDSIPFEDGAFDYLVSWNAMYYMGAPENHFNIETYVEEFARVLRSEGIIVFSVPMPDHRIFKFADSLDEKYVVIRNDPLNIRNGLVMRRFMSEREIAETFDPLFRDIEFGKIVDDFFGDDDAHWWIGYAIKK